MIGGQVEDRRGRGRIPTRWFDAIEDVTRVKFQGSMRKAEDRPGEHCKVKRLMAVMRLRRRKRSKKKLLLSI